MTAASKELGSANGINFDDVQITRIMYLNDDLTVAVLVTVYTVYIHGVCVTKKIAPAVIGYRSSWKVTWNLG